MLLQSLWIPALAAFGISLGTSLMVTRHWAESPLWNLHGQGTNPQALHHRLTPRVGGLGLALGLFLAWQLLEVQSAPSTLMGPTTTVILGSLSAAVVGLIQDLSSRLTPGMRLLSVGALATGVTVLGQLTFTHIPGLGQALMHSPWLALILACLLITGLTNAFNIIDGLNGLASACAMQVLASLALVAWWVGDSWVLVLAICLLTAVAGFFVLNYPRGLIFLGDGGAYLCGFASSVLAFLLVERNTGEVSPLYPILVCLYPVMETIFSMYRRRRKGLPMSQADRHHLHTLMFRRLPHHWLLASRRLMGSDRRSARNSGTSPYLWALCACAVLPATLFHRHTLLLAGGMGAFVAVYIVLYRRVVRFKIARWSRH